MFRQSDSGGWHNSLLILSGEEPHCQDVRAQCDFEFFPFPFVK